VKNVDRLLFAVCILLYMTNIVFQVLGKTGAEQMGFGFHLQTLIFLIAAGFLYLRPDSMRWFGDKLSSDHDVSKTISHTICAFILMVPLIFNLLPIATIFDF
jgi:hypothetical protein